MGDEFLRDTEPYVDLAMGDEPGERLLLSGVVRDKRGVPVPNASIVVYHSDARGNYGGEGGAPRHWVKFHSGPHGEYSIFTIVPGGSEGAPHIHFEISARGHPEQSLVVPVEDGKPPVGDDAMSSWRPDQRITSEMKRSATSDTVAVRDGVRYITRDLRLR